MEIRQIIAQLDGLYADGNLKEADRCLKEWSAKAQEEADNGALLTIYNEQEGLYRTTGRAAEAADISERALDLVIRMGLGGTIHHGTTLLNGATANRAAGNLKEALELYREAEDIFRGLGEENSYQMAALRNNISQIYQELGEHEKALSFLSQALEQIETMDNNGEELATTHANQALSLMALGRLEEAQQAVDQAVSYYENGGIGAHFGSALSAAGELAFRKGDREEALKLLNRALSETLNRFGENDGCRIIRKNIEKIQGGKLG